MAKEVGLAVPSGYTKAEGECPYCVSQKAKSVLVFESGSVSCLNCGKHWHGWQVGKVYSAALERKDQAAVAQEEAVAKAYAEGKKAK